MARAVLAACLAGGACVAHAADVAAQQTPGPGALYQQHCASCHGEARTGGMGPALLPASLDRLKQAEATRVVTHGRVATQMPAFASVLSEAEIRGVTQWLYTAPDVMPAWGEADIRASRVVSKTERPDQLTPRWPGDPLNLFVVVEGGDHHVSLVDGDRLEVIHRFASRYALHGGPKFSPDGRFVYFGSRDGWVTKYDLYNLRVVAEVRAGLNMRNVAVSGDGRWVMAGNHLPRTVVLFDADLNLVKTLPAASLDGRVTSRVSAVYDAAPRRSFIVAMKDLPELWEVSYDAKAEPVHDGLVHDYRMGEAIAKPGFLTPRRTPLSQPLDDFFFDPGYRHVLGTGRAVGGEASVAAAAQVINLDARSRVATLPLGGMPHLGSGIALQHQGRAVLATPSLDQPVISVIDMKAWTVMRQIPLPGPGFFLRSHPQSPYMWADSMLSPASRHILTVIDKQTLEPKAQIQVPPGRTLAHVEFTRDGSKVLASLWEQDGALIVYDAVTLKELKRLPMSKPVGKYNVFNKTTRNEGTSH
ncbi:cytochrome C oxidase Cbb3 [Aquabacterium olei]|uniref:Cytochrome C oxidase Cbb3 n=1 Tax=Aquabacterium olei TaxID=1296669 RepID=A0A2U8FR88_9BURK|nr:cytochrome C oxidase Cbb3 [Aquabacterium olei]